MRSVKDDAGSAIVEFVSFGVTSLLTISLLLSGVFVVQKASFTAQSAVREGTRAFVTAANDIDAFTAAEKAASLVFSDVDMTPPVVNITCSTHPCLAPTGIITVSVRFPIDLMVATLTVRASHQERVSPWL